MKYRIYSADRLEDRQTNRQTKQFERLGLEDSSLNRKDGRRAKRRKEITAKHGGPLNAFDDMVTKSQTIN